MQFEDRLDAGRRLASALRIKANLHPVVLGIPRGGVPVAAEVARALEADLGVIVARKLGAPGNAELAIGATTVTGSTYINERIAAAVGADERYIAFEKDRQVHEAQRREEQFDGRRRPSIKGRTVIVVDDGIATGATAIAALRFARSEGAARVILAVPVGSLETIKFMRGEADEVVCLQPEADFWGVGQFYLDFSPVSDEDVRQILDEFTAAGAADTERVEVTRDGVKLAGVLETPASKGPWPLVIFVHGLGSGKDSPRNVVVAKRLLDAGIATLLFDLCGHGESSKDYASMGFAGGGVAGYVADLEAMFAWAVARDDVVAGRIGVAGSSLGAVVAARALARGRIAPCALVLRAPPLAEEDFAAITVPALVIIGSDDPLRSGVTAEAAACPCAQIEVVQGAGHLFEEPGTLEEATRLTVDWFVSQLLP